MKLKTILGFFLGWKFLILILAYFASFLLPLKSIFTALHDLAYRDFGSHLPYLVWVWGNFDGFFYMAIAKRGYFLSEQPFFPLFPYLIKWITAHTGWPYLISGQFISNLSFLLALLVAYRTLIIDKKTHLFTLFLFVILLFPTSFFYGAVYNDALFFLLATLTIYFSRCRLWTIASITGGLATFTRLNGLALLFYLLFEYFTAKNENPRATWNWQQLKNKAFNFFSPWRFSQEKIYLLTLIPLAFLGYLAYVQTKFGNWNLVFSSMKIWGQDKVTFPLIVFWRYFKILIPYPTFKLDYWVALFELTFVIFYILLLIYSWRKIRFSYWIFFALSIFIPSLTGTFQGMPRYGLHLYPLFLSLSLFLENKNLSFKIIYFLISVALLFFALTLFTRGYFVA